MSPCKVLCVALLAAALVSCVAADNEQNAFVAEEDIDISHPMRVSSRKEDPLDHELSDRASLLFRSMDHDRDRKISEEDVRQSAEQLALHMPGVTVDDFVSFMQMADKNGDGSLDRDELMQGIADGLEAAKTVPAELQSASGAMLETDAQVVTRRKGFFGKVGGLLKKGANFVKKAVDFGKSKLNQMGRKMTGGVDTAQDGCVMCQYIVERAEANVKQSGVIPSMSGVAAFDAFLEVESDADTVDAIELEEDGAMSLLEVENGLASKQLYFDQTAAGIIGSTRQSTRVQRQMERQKYNEIYRVVDITLDDVCEQGMPNSFYGYCKQVYKVQSDVVDGLRYQYRPSDICFRIGMCGKSSYITKGIHSRYK